MIWTLITTKLFSPVGKVAAIAGSVFVAVWYVIRIVAQAAKLKLENQALKETRDAVRKANDARSAADVNNQRGGLLNDDGFKRE